MTKVTIMADGYRITEDDGTSKKVKIVDTVQNIAFWIENSVLTLMDNLSSGKSSDAVIPHEFLSGHRIDYLGEFFVYGKYNKITVSDGIGVTDFAFRRASVNEVVWPCGWKTIPPQCFAYSEIKKLSNIENVERISYEAFTSSNIEEIDIHNVREIEERAFSHTYKMRKIDWPAHCLYVPMLCFHSSGIEKIRNLDNIVSIGTLAFNKSALKNLDLSGTNNISFDDRSLAGLSPECNVVMPYYITQEEAERAFYGKSKEE